MNRTIASITGWIIIGIVSAAFAQSPTTLTSAVEGYRAAAEKQVAELKAKGSTDGTESLTNVKAAYERARSQQQDWLAAILAAAGAQSHEPLQAAANNAATAVFECIQARRAALGRPAFAAALADGVQRGIAKDYTAEGERRVRELKAAGPGRVNDASQRMSDALAWKPWETIK